MQKQQIIPQELLQRSKKILFVTHLAIGDFTYLQNYFKAFSQKYPEIEMDLWIDEVRRTRFFWRWARLKKYSLYDWTRQCGLFKTVYDQTYSPATLKKSLQIAQVQNYPIVVSLAGFRHHSYACLARKISPKGFVAASVKKTKKYTIFKNRFYKKLDCVFYEPAQYDHVSDMYAAWFKKLFGFSVSEQSRMPFVDIPKPWVIYAKLRFLKYGIDKKNNNFGRVFFINAFAKNKKRSWALSSVVAFIRAIKRDDQWNDISFIVNAPPFEYQRVKETFDELGLNNVIVFSARQNFFQLPAIISCCDLVISVETAVMHLANAVKIPVVALMRQKNPKWAPFDRENSFVITTHKRSQWVRSIPWQQVVDATLKFSQEKLG